MKFKIKKYLVVLLAVLMLASLTVIPTSAAITGGKWSTVDGSVLFYRHVFVWSESTQGQGQYCWAEVSDCYGKRYAYDIATSAVGGPLYVELNGPSYPLKIDATACSWSGDWDYL